MFVMVIHTNKDKSQLWWKLLLRQLRYQRVETTESHSEDLTMRITPPRFSEETFPTDEFVKCYWFRVHFAPGKIAITLELLSQFLRFLD